MVALGAGTLTGALIALALVVLDVARERGTAPVILVAIAVFYPVFAAEHGEVEGTLAHGAIALAFLALAILSVRIGPWLAAFGVVLHGLLDVVFHATSSPGPVWWPSFCGALDLVLGGLLILHLRRTPPRVPCGGQA